MYIHCYGSEAYNNVHMYMYIVCMVCPLGSAIIMYFIKISDSESLIFLYKSYACMCMFIRVCILYARFVHLAVSCMYM